MSEYTDCTNCKNKIVNFENIYKYDSSPLNPGIRTWAGVNPEMYIAEPLDAGMSYVPDFHNEDINNELQEGPEELPEELPEEVYEEDVQQIPLIQRVFVIKKNGIDYVKLFIMIAIIILIAFYVNKNKDQIRNFLFNNDFFNNNQNI